MSGTGLSNMTDDAITRHFFNGFIRLHILHHAAEEAVYGAEIVEELNRHGYRLSQGTLYPTLHSLERQGYLRCRPRLVAGRWRRYYEATATGRRALEAARQKLQELVTEVLEGHDEPFDTIRQKHASRSRKHARSANKSRKG
jgi:DNA-binding PadR family transcriptional regulator